MGAHAFDAHGLRFIRGSMGLSSTVDRSERIKKVISDLPELDLSGFIEVGKTICNHGSSCDLYKGYCSRNMKDVAVKKIRTFLIENEVHSKVDDRFVFSHLDCTLTVRLLEIMSRNFNLG